MIAWVFATFGATAAVVVFVIIMSCIFCDKATSK